MLAIAGVCVLGPLAYILFECLAEVGLQAACYWTARLAVRLMTGEKVRISRLGEPVAGLDAAGVQRAGDHRMISVEFASMIGLAIWITALALLFAAAFWWSGFAR